MFPASSPAGAFSDRTAFDPTQNALAAALAAHRAAERPLLDLTASNPTRAGIPYDFATIRAALSHADVADYDPRPLGDLAARAAVAADLCAHGPPVGPDRVVLTASTSEAYAWLFKLLCDPGDEVLVPRPSYPLFDHLARFEGVRLVPYRLDYDGEWHVDPGSLRAAVGPRTRAVLVVSPNNPTGSHLKADERSLFEGLGLPVIADEVFARHPLPGASGASPALPALALRGVPVFALGGLSKLAGLPQIKVAWIAAGGPEPLVEEALRRLELVGDTFLSVGTPAQLALPALLASRGPAEAAIRARVHENHARLVAALDPTSPAELLRAEGGWYATLRLPRTRTEEAWALAFLERDDVLVHPGHFFDFATEAFVVLSLLTPPADFAEGVRRLLARVSGSAGAAPG